MAGSKPLKTDFRQRKAQEAILSSMVESVLAIDREQRVIELNRAALELFDIGPEDAKQKPVHEIVQNAELRAFISKALKSPNPIEAEITLREKGEIFIQANGSVLRDPQGETIGAVIVLNDVTRLRKLETMRQEFVANVSHELKTPVTSIKGFVETLLDGALENPEEARKFLEIIAKHAERLHTIIEDLLSLSRIEQEEIDRMTWESGPIREVLAAAMQACDLKAHEKKISMELSVPPGLSARFNPRLLEQAVVNLVDNAVKYSDPGDTISLEAKNGDDEVLISVSDHGSGIEAEHLPRLFERFYRVDKARSRKQGGTGLGLAIVKHIVQAHGGRVIVESKPGKAPGFAFIYPSKLEQVNGDVGHPPKRN